MPKYGENIYHRKDGRWEARYIAMRLPNGKAKYKSVYGRTHDIDLVRAIGTFFFLWLGAEPMLEKLDRIKTKYGLAE